MATWTSGTPWRQGHVLTGQCASELDLTPPEQPDARVVVISHDCDLEASESAEPNVEVIVGSLVEKPDGNFLSARGARTLHLPFDKERGPKYIELRATNKAQLTKSALGKYSHDASLPLVPDDKHTLQQWLAQRYFRAAFPTAFVERFGKGRLNLDEPFRKILSRLANELVAVYFDLDGGEDNERADTRVYSLSIYLVAAVEPDPEKAEEACKKARDDIEKLFKANCMVGAAWIGIELEGCYVETVETVTLRTASKLRKWNADYLSLRAHPQAAVVN